MNKLFLVTLTFLFACGESIQQGDLETVVADSKEEQIKDSEPAITKPDGASLLSLFPSYTTDNIEVEVSEQARSSSSSESKFIPLAYQPYFDGHLYAIGSESTGSRPVGRISLGEQASLLILFQQDDYGPIYYGLIYDNVADKILAKEIIAQEWGDAGDSQVIKSKIKHLNGLTHITKFIETCHADLEISDEEVTAQNEECKDSVAVVLVDNALKFKQIK